MESKKCCRCKEVKPLSEFYNNKSKYDGKCPDCKQCHKDHYISVDKRKKHYEMLYKKDGTPDQRCLRRKEGYELPYGQRPQRRAWREERKEKLNKYNREYRVENWEQLKVKKVEYLNRIREEGIKEYGGKCVCCGEITTEFLTIDHINGRSEEEVKHGGRAVKGKKLFLHLKSKGWPKDNYQLLCWNCNCAKGLYGKCPHEGR